MSAERAGLDGNGPLSRLDPARREQRRTSVRDAVRVMTTAIAAIAIGLVIAAGMARAVGGLRPGRVAVGRTGSLAVAAVLR